MDKILIFAVLKQWFLQQRETEASVVFIIPYNFGQCKASKLRFLLEVVFQGGFLQHQGFGTGGKAEGNN